MEVLIFILIVKIFTRHRADCAELFVRFEGTVVHPASAGTWEQRKSRVKATVQRVVYSFHDLIHYVPVLGHI